MPRGDPNYPEITGVLLQRYITLERGGPLSLRLQRDNLRQKTPLASCVTLPPLWSFFFKNNEAVSLNIRAGTRSRYLHLWGKNLICDHSPFANIWAVYLKLSGVLCLQTIRQSWSLRDMSSPAESWGQLNVSKCSWGELLLLHPGLRWGTKSAGRSTEEFKNEE